MIISQLFLIRLSSSSSDKTASSTWERVHHWCQREWEVYSPQEWPSREKRARRYRGFAVNLDSRVAFVARIWNVQNQYLRSSKIFNYIWGLMWALMLLRKIISLFLLFGFRLAFLAEVLALLALIILVFLVVGPPSSSTFAPTALLLSLAQVWFVDASLWNLFISRSRFAILVFIVILTSRAVDAFSVYLTALSMTFRWGARTGRWVACILSWFSRKKM